MGWQTAIVAIRSKTGRSNIASVRKAFGLATTPTKSISFEDATLSSAAEISLAYRQGWTIAVIPPALHEAISENLAFFDPRSDAVLAKLSARGGEVMGFIVFGTVSEYGIATWENGVLTDAVRISDGSIEFRFPPGANSSAERDYASINESQVLAAFDSLVMPLDQVAAAKFQCYPPATSFKTSELYRIGCLKIEHYNAPAFRDALKSDDVNVRCLAIVALEKLEPSNPARIQELADNLERLDPLILHSAIVSIVTSGPHASCALESLTKLLGSRGKCRQYGDTQVLIRELAACAIATIDSKRIEVLPILLEAIEKSTTRWHMGLEAAKVLRHIGADAASTVPVLHRLATGPHSPITILAKVALSGIVPSYSVTCPYAQTIISNLTPESPW